MQEIKIILLVVATVVALYGYIQYGREIPKGTLRPRTFTWLIWGVLGLCVSVIQIQNGADLGAIGAATGAVSGFILAAMAWYYGRRKVYATDITSMLLVCGVLFLWAIVGDRLAIVAATLVYLIGFIPTVVRAHTAPAKERFTPFVTSSVKYAISLLLLGVVTLETALYPAVLLVANLSFIVMLWWRRR